MTFGLHLKQIPDLKYVRQDSGNFNNRNSMTFSQQGFIRIIVVKQHNVNTTFNFLP